MSIVCKHCGSDKGFTQVGSVECEASRDTRSLRRDEATGAIVVEWASVDVDDFSVSRIDDVDYIECKVCHAEARAVEDLAASLVDLRRALCKCGHLRHEHEEGRFDPKIHVRGLVACQRCACEDYEAEPVHEVSRDQLALVDA